jgi:hypothetical protein
MNHTVEEDFQHFLCYSGLGKESLETINKMRKAFEAGRPPEGMGSFDAAYPAFMLPDEEKEL